MLGPPPRRSTRWRPSGCASRWRRTRSRPRAWPPPARPPRWCSRPPTQPKDGLTILAVFFVAAQALERLLEPLSGLLLPKSRLEDDYQTALGEAERLAGAEPGLGLAAVPTEIEAALHRAAAAKARLEGREQDRAIGYWALATVLAMLGSATLRLYILHELGIANASRGLEILATGLIIGAGTKPLHDLVTNLADRHAQGAAAPGP